MTGGTPGMPPSARFGQLRHVELLERAQALVPSAGRGCGGGKNAAYLQLAALSRDQLIQVITSGRLPGDGWGATSDCPPVFPVHQGGNLKLPPESTEGRTG